MLALHAHRRLRVHGVHRTLVLYGSVYGFMLSMGMGFLLSGLFILVKGNTLKLAEKKLTPPSSLRFWMRNP